MPKPVPTQSPGSIVEADRFAGYSQGVAEAWRQSIFADISDEAAVALLGAAAEREFQAGELLPLPFVTSTGTVGSPALVVSGSVRVFVMSGSRQVTLQYVDAGDAFAIPSAYNMGATSDVIPGGQALTGCHILFLSPEIFIDLATHDITVATAAITGLRSALGHNIGLLAENVLQPLRRRIGRHMLDLAVRDGDTVLVSATVQDIADATGTVREVVTRILKGMREQGLIVREGGDLVILDLNALHDVARGALTRSKP